MLSCFLCLCLSFSWHECWSMQWCIPLSPFVHSLDLCSCYSRWSASLFCSCWILLTFVDLVDFCWPRWLVAWLLTAILLVTWCEGCRLICMILPYCSMRLNLSKQPTSHSKNVFEKKTYLSRLTLLTLSGYCVPNPTHLGRSTTLSTDCSTSSLWSTKVFPHRHHPQSLSSWS